MKQASGILESGTGTNGETGRCLDYTPDNEYSLPCMSFTIVPIIYLNKLSNYQIEEVTHPTKNGNPWCEIDKMIASQMLYLYCTMKWLIYYLHITLYVL